MRLVQQIKMIGRRRDVHLLLIGMLLVGATYQFFTRLNYRGPVTLEFVGYERMGTNKVNGTIMTFRLVNKSGGPITYAGVSETAPRCTAKPMVDDEFKVFGGNFTPDYFWPPRYFILKNDEERVIYVNVDHAEQSWMLRMDYWEGSPSGAWVKKLPAFAQDMFLLDATLLPDNSVLSEPVHRVIASRYGRDAKFEYFMTGLKTNRNGRVTAKMKSEWVKEPITVITVETE